MASPAGHAGVSHIPPPPTTAALSQIRAAQAQQDLSIEPEEVTLGRKEYSPYLHRGYPQRVFWGDTHLHTALSMDAGLFGARLGLDEAYRFARGEEVMASSGQPAKLGRPLDWLVIADHSDGMGFITDLAVGKPGIIAFDQGRRWFEGLQQGGEASAAAALDLIGTFAQGQIDPEMFAEYSPGGKTYSSIWEDVVDAAERYNDPGRFTTLIGFEWTSLVEGANLHRNVIFRDGADKAGRVVPYTTQEPVGSTDPLDLYAWLENYEKKIGGTALALAHNGNLSNGLMFDDRTMSDKKLSRDYAERRSRWEPLYEVTQMKGDGEAHPSLSPNDEFADYGTWDKGSFGPELKTPDMLPKEYARSAWKRGLAYDAKLGANPFKFGVVGSTDTHTALATTQEDNFFGKATPVEPGAPDRYDEKITGVIESPDGREYAIRHYQGLASGLAAVWATENTREALFDAMRRKEVYATTGTRMAVRVFAGWDFEPEELDRWDFAVQGYQRGVPMGGELTDARGSGDAPVFMIRALRDPDGERGKPKRRVLELPPNGFAVEASTTAAAPELRTAKRSPAIPWMYTSPEVAPKRFTLPVMMLRSGMKVEPRGGYTITRPPESPLQK